jgi:hypothetical protein
VSGFGLGGSHRRLRWLAFGLALPVASACGLKERTGGTVTRAVTQIDLGRQLNTDHTVGELTDTFGASDTVFASVQTETMASARITVRIRRENEAVLSDSSQRIPAEGITRTAFRFMLPGGWPPGRYQLEVVLDTTVSGVKEFTIKQPGAAALP